MMDNTHDQHVVATGLHHLPLRVRDNSTSSGNSSHSTSTKSSALTGSTLISSQTHNHHHHHHSNHFTHHGFKDVPSPSSVGGFRHRRCPENLNLHNGGNTGSGSSIISAASRLRSPTESSLGSCSIPDSATTTTYSPSTLASPLSSSYAGDLQDMMLAGVATKGYSRPGSRALHRHRPSTATCSTFVNDEDEDGVPVVVGYPDHQDQLKKATKAYRHNSWYEDEDEDMGATPHEINSLPVSPSTPIKREAPSPPPVEPTEEEDAWETASTASDCCPQDVESILDFTLQLVYGVDTDTAPVPPAQTQDLVQRFVRELGQSIWHNNGSASQDTNGNGTRNSGISSTSSASSTPAGSGGGGRGGNKRKKNNNRRSGGSGGDDDDNNNDASDNDNDGFFIPTKRPRPNPREDDNLRLSCPFRKRNPHRFNVRDHHSCAMTFFPKFAELRQHIVKQHKREDPSAFVCDRCSRDFASRKDLRDHQRLPRDQMCDIADVDPESGIDGPTANKLLSRKRASGASAEVQWREVWNILFPDDDDGSVPRDYHFTPVIEHFELSTSYLDSFAFLKADLMDKISNPATLETLATKFQQCFIETVERCISEAQTMPYANRSNKRTEQLAAAAAATPAISAAAAAAAAAASASALPRKMKEVAPRPDSGIMMDDGSEESGSVMGGGGGFPGGRLSQRESMRTVVRGTGGGRRGSSLAPAGGIATVRGSLMAPASRSQSAIFDGGIPGGVLPTIPASSSMTAVLDHHTPAGIMAPADVHAWTHGVPTFPNAYEPMPDQFMSSGLMHHPIPTSSGGHPSTGDLAMDSGEFAAWAATQSFYHDAGMGMPGVATPGPRGGEAESWMGLSGSTD